MDFDLLLTVGIGQMAMGRKEFGFISPRDFYNKLKGFTQLRQADYELVRLQTIALLNIQMEKKHRINKPEDLWTFPWEKKEIKKIDKEIAQHRAIRFKEKTERIIKRHGG